MWSLITLGSCRRVANHPATPFKEINKAECRVERELLDVIGNNSVSIKYDAGCKENM